MSLSRTILEVIDMRSFSNLWFWIALAVMWSSASHRVLGVPWDLVLRARRRGGEAQKDLEELTAICVRRSLYILRVTGVWSIGLTSFLLVIIFTIGFHYDRQFCQALFLMAFPMALVGLLSLRTALKIEAGDNRGAALHRRLRAQRLQVQTLGVLSIFATALWGMYQNLSTSVLGG